MPETLERCRKRFGPHHVFARVAEKYARHATLPQLREVCAEASRAATRRIRRRVAARPARLPLAELEAAAGFRAAVLLALDDARVAGQEAFPLHRRTQRGLVASQRRRDTVTNGACLTRQTAALHRRLDVILTAAIGDVEDLVDDQA